MYLSGPGALAEAKDLIVNWMSSKEMGALCASNWVGLGLGRRTLASKASAVV